MRLEDLTDDQLAGMSAPPAAAEAVTASVVPEEVPLPDANDGAAADNIDKPADQDPVGGNSPEEVAEVDTSDVELEVPPTNSAATPEASVEGEAVPPANNEPDYKSLYEKLMSPLRANGKDIELKSPEELLSLAQQGANYTKNMQNIRHHKKSLMMLEKNGLLDESKISYLIDLSNGDPAAIQKLLKEKNIDPLDVDTRGESTYEDQGNHRLTDNEVSFRDHVDEIVSTPQGTETISVLNSWDQASKDQLWQNPQLMSVIHNHRLNGTYDVVANEVARRRAVGTIPSNIPFLDAYEKVGEEMLAAQSRQQAAPVATRVATPAASVQASGKVAAAAPTRSGSRRATPIVNPLALSDEEFEKEFAKMQGRL